MPRALINCQVNPSTVNYSQFSDGPNRVNDDWRASERYQSVAASIFDDEDRFVFYLVLLILVPVHLMISAVHLMPFR